MEWLEGIGHVIGVIAGIASGAAVLCGIVYVFVKWILKQNKQSEDIQALRSQHEADNKAVEKELCVISYALLATLDGLKQLHCNGEVSNAYKMMQKHINKSAHDQ